ncbi:MAG: hypothetical protein ACK5M1_08645 [Xanthomarina gelatinilytica]|uniref:hypothetical protein n=1 Tax=Xanthomarina gelatinilytica TaxID=1137281 RepID=UPI003A8A5993
MRCLFLLLFSFLFLFSCNEKNIQIKTWDDLQGVYENTTAIKSDKKDTLKTELSFNGEVLKVMFKYLSADEAKNNPELSFYHIVKYHKGNIVNKDTLVLKSENIKAWSGANVIGSEVFVDDYQGNEKMPDLKIVRLEKKLKIIYDLQQAFNQIEIQNERFRLENKIPKSIEFTLFKEELPNDWWYFNPAKNIYYPSGETAPITMIEQELTNYSRRLSTRNDFFGYFKLNDYEKFKTDKDIFLPKMTENGSFKETDFNDDGLKDVMCYFTDIFKKKIHFYIFFNNGVKYDIVHHEILSGNIFTCDTLKGKNVLDINYVDDYLTNILYYNNLKGKFDTYLTD